jgi:3-methylcrotonyl-CoA carboxylase alpha subunit
MSEREYKISGKRHRVSEQAPVVTELRAGGWIILERPSAGGGVERVRIAQVRVGSRVSALVSGRPYFAELKALSRASSTGGSGDSDLVAQFPGKVRKILVQPGTRVGEGDSLMLLEAMKMEFAIKAPGVGVVRKVLVSEGQQLSPGTLLIDFEAESEK